MAKIDKTREELGWLKAGFVLLVAVDVSLMGWAAQNFLVVPPLVTVATVTAIVVITVATVKLYRVARGKIVQLEDL